MVLWSSITRTLIEVACVSDISIPDRTYLYFYQPRPFRAGGTIFRAVGSTVNFDRTFVRLQTRELLAWGGRDEIRRMVNVS